MYKHINLTDNEVRSLIKSKKILYAGYKKLKIYGLLSCKSGKRMKRENRVFFESEDEALEYGYRRCKNCMKNVRN